MVFKIGLILTHKYHGWGLTGPQEITSNGDDNGKDPDTDSHTDRTQEIDVLQGVPQVQLRPDETQGTKEEVTDFL